MALTPFELVELRLLEQGRASGSDGKEWQRMAVGVTATAVALLLVVSLTQNLPVAIGVAAVGVASTALWIIRAESKAVNERLAYLRSQV